jgi:nucleoside-diphosphate-sugar epimerase
MGTKVSLEFHPLPSDDPQKRRPDISKAKRLLGWQPRVPLSQGLRETIEYFK